MATTDQRDDDQQASKKFHDLVNMTPKQLEKWLDTDENKAVGQNKGGTGKSTGHHMGREIVELLHTKKSDDTVDVFDRMRKAPGYIERRSASCPKTSLSPLDISIADQMVARSRPAGSG